MPDRPQRVCAHAGCRTLTAESRCAEHRKPQHTYEARRGSASERGYGWDWQKYRAWFICQLECSVCGKNHTVCALCLIEGFIERAFAVDHITPHRGNQQLFWDHTNHQSLCESHHNRKAREERLT